MTERRLAVKVWKTAVRNAFTFGIIAAVGIGIGGLVAKVVFGAFVALIVFELVTAIPAIATGLATPFVPKLKRAVDSLAWSLVTTLGRVVDNAVSVLLAYLLYRSW